MLSVEMVAKIQQERMNAIAAKYLHQQRLGNLRRLCQGVDLLGLVVPGLYFVPRYLTKGTTAHEVIEIVWEILAAVLLAAALLRLILKWDTKAEQHFHLLSENIDLVHEADQLIEKQKTVAAYRGEAFIDQAARIEKADRQLISGPRDEDRQWAYREALKECNAQCPRCTGDPWNYKKGDCQLCGNTVRIA
jgi:mobilome CxxCx(11)CxxC protein